MNEDRPYGLLHEPWYLDMVLKMYPPAPWYVRIWRRMTGRQRAPNALRPTVANGDA